MRKKTIKFYFFKPYLARSVSGYLFCLSKRSFRQNKQNIYFSKKKKRAYKKKKFLEFLKSKKFYKRVIKSKLILKQWNLNRVIARIYFLQSFFYKTLSKNKLRKRLSKLLFKQNLIKRLQIKLWFFLKKRFSDFNNRAITRYPKLGIISSHATHVLSRKNISYQTITKYRSKMLSAGLYNGWIHVRTTYLNCYLSILYRALYFFMYNPANQTISYDKDFNLNITENFKLNFYNKVSPYKNLFSYNYNQSSSPIDPNLDIFSLYNLIKNYEIIDACFTDACNLTTAESDDLFRRIASEYSITPIILNSRIFIFTTTSIIKINYDQYIYNYISIFFRYNIINISDI